MRACSFTGHRVIERAAIPHVEQLLKKAIEYVYNEGCRTFFSGGAIGFDTMAAKAVVMFRMGHPDARLVIVIPCKNQSSAWGDGAKEMYDYLLSVADEVIYASDGDYTRDCMRVRNQMLADLCDVMIAYVTNSRSGSAQTVRMAERQGKKVYNLYKSSV